MDLCSADLSPAFSGFLDIVEDIISELFCSARHAIKNAEDKSANTDSSPAFGIRGQDSAHTKCQSLSISYSSLYRNFFDQISHHSVHPKYKIFGQ